jgi:hypothetical protein
MLPDTQHNREQAFEHMYGMPQEWLDELVTDWQEPLMGGLTRLAMSVLSDAQERIALGDGETARQYINRAKYIIKQMEK